MTKIYEVLPGNKITLICENNIQSFGVKTIILHGKEKTTVKAEIVKPRECFSKPKTIFVFIPDDVKEEALNGLTSFELV